MDRQVAIFRADASSHIGGGHVMRCLTLAGKLLDAGWKCKFACTDETLETMPLLVECGYETMLPEEIGENPAQLLIVDHYELDRAFEEKCRYWADTILVIDDLADRMHDCDILMDQTFGREALDYKPFVPAGCKILTGSDYALLRPQFSEMRQLSLKRRSEKSGEIENILVMLGAGDKENVTGFVLEALEKCDPGIDVDIIMGANAPHIAEIQNMAKLSRHDMRVHRDVKDVAALMYKADLAIGAGGTASWERCCLALPTMVIEIADNQHKIIAELADAGAVRAIGWYKDLDESDVIRSLGELRDHPDLVMDMSIKAASICDGEGAQRVGDVVVKRKAAA